MFLFSCGWVFEGINIKERILKGVKDENVKRNRVFIDYSIGFGIGFSVLFLDVFLIYLFFLNLRFFL